jgi:O-antigen ligase
VIVTGGAAVVVAVLAVILLLGPERLPFLRTTFATADSRLTLYRNTLYLASDYAFTGIGLGQTFGMVYSRFSLLIFVPFLTYAHNLPLAVWLGQGILGLLALTGIILAFYRLVDRTMRRAAPDALFHGVWLGVTATLLHGLTDARQYVESPWAMPALFVLLALTEAIARLALLQTSPNGRRGAAIFPPKPKKNRRHLNSKGAAAGLIH